MRITRSAAGKISPELHIIADGKPRIEAGYPDPTLFIRLIIDRATDNRDKNSNYNVHADLLPEDFAEIIRRLCDAVFAEGDSGKNARATLRKMGLTKGLLSLAAASAGFVKGE